MTSLDLEKNMENLNKRILFLAIASEAGWEDDSLGII